ncbi:MAG: hypothetical protein AB7I41_22175 [Candidatus Sericytochromatia bacterium]
MRLNSENKSAPPAIQFKAIPMPAALASPSIQRIRTGPLPPLPSLEGAALLPPQSEVLPTQDSILLSGAQAEAPSAPKPLTPFKERVQAAADQVKSSLLELVGNLQAEGRYQSLSQSQSKGLLLAEKLLRQHSGPAFDQLSAPQKLALLELLVDLNLEPAALLRAEVQNRGGNSSSGRVTGSGKYGHFVPSALSSLTALIQTQRLSPELLTRLREQYHAPLSPELESQRNSLFLSSLQNVALPHTINQRGRGTCAATVPEMLLAQHDPVRYVQLVTALASPGGEVPSALLPGGGELLREAGSESQDLSGRSFASRLLQPALMEYANGALNYDNAQDQHSDASTGLDSAQSAHLLNGLFGAEQYQATNYDAGYTIAEYLNKAEEAVNQGHPVVIGAVLPGGGHALLLTRVDREAGLAYVYNPWGELNTVDLDFLLEHLQSAELPTGPPPPGSGDALDRLSGPAADPSVYTPLRLEAGGRFTVNILNQDPATAQDLSESQKQTLCDQFLRLGLPNAELERVIHMAQAGGVPPILLDRINEIQDPDAALKLLRLGERLALNQLPPEQQAAILLHFPEQLLSTQQFEALLTALDQQDQAQLQAGLNAIQAPESSANDSLAELQAERSAEPARSTWLRQLCQAPAETQIAALSALLEAPKKGDGALLVALFTAAPPELQHRFFQALHPFELGQALPEPDQAKILLKLLQQSEFPAETQTWIQTHVLAGQAKTNPAAVQS